MIHVAVAIQMLHDPWSTEPNFLNAYRSLDHAYAQCMCTCPEVVSPVALCIGSLARGGAYHRHKFVTSAPLSKCRAVSWQIGFEQPFGSPAHLPLTPVQHALGIVRNVFVRIPKQ